ncbi:MAG: DMT family transporter, partial [Bowdeniella nasicola]|nr:DMT family transporter [Bowdeniella nasicola]
MEHSVGEQQRGRLVAWAALALVGVTAVWGSTFFLIKGLLTEVSALDFLTVRFAMAAAVGALVFARRLAAASSEIWVKGLALGLVYFVAQVLQTVGLRTTDASISGFITGMYVVLTPVLLWVLSGQRVSPRVWLATALATVGLMALSLRGLHMGAGEVLTLAGALLYAVHIVLVARWVRGADPLALAVIQLIAIAGAASVTAVARGLTVPTSLSAWAAITYMALAAALGAMVAQTWAQAHLSATTAAIIMVTEPVFAAFFALLFGGEALSVRLVVGGALILAGMLLTEVG